MLLYALLKTAEHGCPVNPFSAVKALDAVKECLFQFRRRLRRRWQPLLIFFEAAQPSSNHFTGSLVQSASNLGFHEPLKFRRQGYVHRRSPV
jgi:hypothetical protein